MNALSSSSFDAATTTVEAVAVVLVTVAVDRENKKPMLSWNLIYFISFHFSGAMCLERNLVYFVEA